MGDADLDVSGLRLGFPASTLEEFVLEGRQGDKDLTQFDSSPCIAAVDD